MQNPKNFRDIGGIKTKDGRTIRKGLLFRSAQPVALPQTDLTALASHSITHIIDFRRPWETKLDPTDTIDGAVYVNLDVMADAPPELSLDDWMASLHSNVAENTMTQYYLNYVRYASAKRAYADFLRICADAKGGVLFHCFAGKDRTGMAAAVLLKLLGASDNDIFADYLKTMQDVEKRLPGQLEEYRAKGLDDNKLAALAIVYSIKREYLEAAFAAIDAEYGNFENYVKGGLGLSADEIKKLHDKYLLG